MRPQRVGNEQGKRQAEDVEGDEQRSDEAIAPESAGSDAQSGRSIQDPAAPVSDDAREIDRAPIVEVGDDDKPSSVSSLSRGKCHAFPLTGSLLRTRSGDTSGAALSAAPPVVSGPTQGSQRSPAVQNGDQGGRLPR